MAPEPGNPQEAEGVPEPGRRSRPRRAASTFSRDWWRGELLADRHRPRPLQRRRRPLERERLGIALEPEADYERRPDGGGGCEDPRITLRRAAPRDT